MARQLDERLVAFTKKAEGLKLKAYQDTEGVWTIGYGTNLQELQIGEDLAQEWLELKLRDALSYATTYPWFAGLSPERQMVIVDMVYNLGPNRFDGFIKFKAALQARDFRQAAKEMLDSKWASQVKGRAGRLAKTMETGLWQP